MEHSPVALDPGAWRCEGAGAGALEPRMARPIRGGRSVALSGPERRMVNLVGLSTRFGLGAARVENPGFSAPGSWLGAHAVSENKRALRYCSGTKPEARIAGPAR